MRLKMYSICLFLFALQMSVWSQAVYLNKGWKFSTGDSMEWAKPGFADGGWQDISIGQAWEEQGHKGYDGYGWYRVHVVIPSSMKDKASLKDLVKFDFAVVDNYNQSFLNGELIGENDRTATVPGPDFTHSDIAWNASRVYVLRSDDKRIHWDADNVIAVRVFDSGGNGGMEMGVPLISMVDVKDYIKVDIRDSVFRYDGEAGRVYKTIRVNNSAHDYVFSGQLHIRCTDAADRSVVFDTSLRLQVGPGAGSDLRFGVRTDGKRILPITYALTEDRGGYAYSEKEYLPYHLSPAVPEEPRVNFPRVFGARPGKETRISIPVSGRGALQVELTGLPEGLRYDSGTGCIMGVARGRGAYRVHVKVSNALGKDERDIRILVGDKLALTPPMGWNSYYACWNEVTGEQVRQAAGWLRDSGLIGHGYRYCNVDDGWAGVRDGAGNIRGNEKFGDMGVLAEFIHGRGLQFGIYSSPGPRTCGGFTGSYGHEGQDARVLAGWGVDYLKYDWCSYDDIGDTKKIADLQRPYKLMRGCLDSVGRDITFSMCQYGMGDVWKWGRSVGGNCWRTTFDITDNWGSLREIGFRQSDYAEYGGPGGWNDADMLQVGWFRGGRDEHPTGLTAPEQYTQFSLWSLLAAPLMLSCDISRLDPFTRSVITNDEVIAIDQDPLGRPARKVAEDGGMQVYSRELVDGTQAFGVFNLTETDTLYRLYFACLGTGRYVSLRDCWQQKDLGLHDGYVDVFLPAHGCVLYKASGQVGLVGREKERVAPAKRAEGWTQLFNGKDLSGWEHVGPGRMVVEDGMMKTDNGMGLLYYKGRKFGNCVIRVVYKCEHYNDNSGIFIRIPFEPLEPWMPVYYGYEVQIDNYPETSGEDSMHVSGALYSLTRPLARPGKPGPGWNVMEITLDGSQTLVDLNGVRVTEFREGDAVPARKYDYEPYRGRRPDSGYLGLQNESDHSVVWFREVSVRPLSERPLSK